MRLYLYQDHLYYKYQVIFTCIYQAVSTMESGKKMEIVFLGNAQVGKTCYIQKLVKPKSNQMKQSSLAVDFCLYQRKIFSLGKLYNFKLFEVKGSENRLDNKYGQNQQLLLRNIELAIIVFDISNSQSFKDVGQLWLKFAKQNIKCKNIALLVNKIDRQSVLPLRNIYDFAKEHDLQLFFSSNEMDCVRVFDDIIIWHQSKIQVQKLKKSNSKQQLNAIGGLMTKILGFGSGSPTKQDEGLKKKKEQLQNLLLQKVIQMKKCMESQYKNVQHQLENIFKNSTGSEIENKNKQKIQINIVIKSIKDKMYSLCKQVEDSKSNIFAIRKQLLDKQLECASKIQQIKEKQKKILALKQDIASLQKQKQLIYNLDKKQKQQKHKKQDALNKKIKQYEQIQIKLKQQSKILIKKIQMQKIELQNKTQSNLTKQSLFLENQKQKMRQNLEWKQKYQKLSETINDSKGRIIFEQSRAIRVLKSKHLRLIQERIQKSQQQQIEQCLKIYQFDMCCNQSFHTYLDMNSNLFYIIELQEIIIAIYAEQIFKSPSTGKKGQFFLFSRKQDQLINFNLNADAQLWKYDPLTLNFSKGEVTVKFNKNQCSLVFNQKKHNLFNDKKGSIIQLFRLVEKQDKSTYEIKSLQVLKIIFK